MAAIVKEDKSSWKSSPISFDRKFSCVKNEGKRMNLKNSKITCCTRATQQGKYGGKTEEGWCMGKVLRGWKTGARCVHGNMVWEKKRGRIWLICSGCFLLCQSGVKQTVY
ncbi:olfactomedin-like protein 3 [Platysternon megacephalum]|uniref:Olfactomedin-like protein 3 n=1 Tax=Platysternon megacephalum TaxID=55544 RepID=A0A4D9EA47_9SAUR|nr:olfactomedin-like protein 3 [Platysternon megacephalum]